MPSRTSPAGTATCHLQVQEASSPSWCLSQRHPSALAHKPVGWVTLRLAPCTSSSCWAPLSFCGWGGEGREGQEPSFCLFSPSLPPLPPPPLSPVSGTPCAPLGRTSMVFVLWAVSFVTCACSPPPLRCSAAREQGAVRFVHCRVPSTELGSWQALGIGLLDEGILSFIRSFILSNPHRAATAELTPQTTFIAEETAAQVIGRQGAELAQVHGPVNGRVGPGWRVAVLQRWM